MPQPNVVANWPDRRQQGKDRPLDGCLIPGYRPGNGALHSTRQAPGCKGPGSRRDQGNALADAGHRRDAGMVRREHHGQCDGNHRPPVLPWGGPYQVPSAEEGLLYVLDNNRGLFRFNSGGHGA